MESNVGALIIIGIIAAMFIILLQTFNQKLKKEQGSVTLGDIKDRIEQWQKLPNQSEYDMVIDYIKSFKRRLEDWKKLGDILEVDGLKIILEDIKHGSYDTINNHLLLIPELVFMMYSRGYDRYTVVGYDSFKIQGFNSDCVKQLEELLKDVVISKSTLFKLKEKSPCIKHDWYSVNNGQYYLNRKFEFETENFDKYNFNLYKFEDWSIVDITEETFDIEEVTPCEDPKQTYWKRFLELEMKAKKKRQDECHKFIDEVLQQQQEYNDLQLTYEMMPSAPITDVVSFNNFCKVVSKDHGFKDYEIQNYLLLKQGGINVK